MTTWDRLQFGGYQYVLDPINSLSSLQRVHIFHGTPHVSDVIAQRCDTRDAARLIMFSRSNRKSLAADTPDVETHSKLKYTHRLSLCVSVTPCFWSGADGPLTHPLASYELPPGNNVTLEEFETWAVDRLRGACFNLSAATQLNLTRVLAVLAEIEASAIRDLPFDGVKAVVQTQTDKYLPLNPNLAQGVDLDFERRKDHVSHYVLRLAFCRSCVIGSTSSHLLCSRLSLWIRREELRAKFVKAESTLFKCRYLAEEPKERTAFLSSRNGGGERVLEEDKRQCKSQLMAATPSLKTDAEFEAEIFYRVSFGTTSV
jgi:hypothetical protein